MNYRPDGKNLRTNEVKQVRAKLAKERAETRNAMSPQQQIDRLDGLLGKEIGATKERARLALQIENAVHHQKKEKKEKKKS
jgi:hypothetical protein